MNIGVLLPNWVGDVVMATPTLRPAPPLSAGQYHGRRPAVSLAALGWKRLADPGDPLGASRPGLDRADLDARPPASPRAARCDARPAKLGICRRHRPPEPGQASNRLCPPRQPALLDHSARAPREAGRYTPISAVDYYLELAYALGCSEEPRQLELPVTAADQLAAEAIWESLDLPDASELVLLNIGGAYGNAKHWPREHSIELARRLAGDMGLTVLILCGPGERTDAASLARDADHPRVLSLADEDVRFGPTKAIIQRARLLISTDSGPRHIAAAVGTPTITLLGPVDPRWSENYQENAIELHLPLPCSPCGRRVCPLGHHQCMRDLTPEMVLSAVRRQLSSTMRRRAA